MIQSLVLIFTYLRKQKQSFRISNRHSNFEFIILGVAQESIAGPIPLNLSTNDLIYITQNTSTFNFANDNTLPTFSKKICRPSSYFIVGIFKNYHVVQRK